MRSIVLLPKLRCTYIYCQVRHQTQALQGFEKALQDFKVALITGSHRLQTLALQEFEKALQDFKAALITGSHRLQTLALQEFEKALQDFKAALITGIHRLLSLPFGKNDLSDKRLVSEMDFSRPVNYKSSAIDFLIHVITKIKPD